MGKGKINVSVENIFPLIKKFLYSDQEIFLRELVSNATDALTKLSHMSSIGEIKGDIGNLGLEIKVNKKGKTLHGSSPGDVHAGPDDQEELMMSFDTYPQNSQ